MKSVLAIALILGVAVVCRAGVELVEPTEPLNPDQVYTFVFEVGCDQGYPWFISQIWIVYGETLTIVDGTMGYEEIVPGRPNFDLLYGAHGVIWRDLDPEGGVLWEESTLVWFDVSTPGDLNPGTSIRIEWMLLGSSGNTMDLGSLFCATPVEHTTWGSVKALFRDW